MAYTVSYRGAEAGWAEAEQTARGLKVHAVCKPVFPGVLRLYAAAEKGPLRIGVLEPEGGELVLRREISLDTLRQAGVETVPEVYFLDDGQQQSVSMPNVRIGDAEKKQKQAAAPSVPSLGDTLLERAVAQGVACRREGNRWRLSCAFSADKENPLAFALTVCAVENGETVLHWPLQ